MKTGELVMKEKFITKAVVTFNEPLQKKTPKSYNKARTKRNFVKQKGDTLVQFATKVSVKGEDYHNLKTLFLNQIRIEEYAKTYLNNNPEVSLQHLKDKVNDFIKNKGIKIKHFTTVNNAIRNYHNLRDRGIVLNPQAVKYLMFNENSLNNGRFTITYRRDKIVIDYLNIVIRLEDKLPSNFPDNTFFHLNISTKDPETLDNLQVIFQIPQ